MSATTVSGWSEEKPKHVRDVASALRASVREEGCNSLEECGFSDLAKFLAQLGNTVHEKSPPSALFSAQRALSEHGSARVSRTRGGGRRRAHGDVAAMPGVDVDAAEAEDALFNGKSTSRRARVDWLAPLKVLGMVVLVGSFGFMLFFSGVLVCDVCQENFERLASGTENVSSGSDSTPQ